MHKGCGPLREEPTGYMYTLATAQSLPRVRAAILHGCTTPERKRHQLSRVLKRQTWKTTWRLTADYISSCLDWLRQMDGGSEPNWTVNWAGVGWSVPLHPSVQYGSESGEESCGEQPGV